MIFFLQPIVKRLDKIIEQQKALLEAQAAEQKSLDQLVVLLTPPPEPGPPVSADIVIDKPV
jgi:hypothetical protein